MLLDITRAIQAPGTEFPFVVSEEILPQEILGEEVVFDKATITGFFSGVGESIFVHGRLLTTAHARCANCLANAKADIEVPFSETFVREADSDDPDRFTFEGSQIDFAHLALSLSVLALPMRFKCKADCEGLCGTCGKETNHCTCRKESPERNPFATLKQLLTKDEEV